jgi:hypothetical protein
MGQNLKAEFHKAMESVYETAANDYKYTATIFKKMLVKHGGLVTAQRLLGADAPQYGLLRLKELGALKISMEYVVLDPKYRELFMTRELETAKQRLIDFGLKVDELPK